MSVPSRLLVVSLLSLLSVATVQAQTNPTFTTNLSLGSSGPQVLALQQILNQDPDTQIATSGPGSRGNETGQFGPLTWASVIRFQEKYATDVLTPVGLTKGSGRVGSYTRAKLNALFARKTSVTTNIPTADFLVKESEKIDVYAGDKAITTAQNKIFTAINAGIASRLSSRSMATVTLPVITAAEVPNVSISAPTPRSGLPGSSVSIKGSGISGNSVIYFGNTYIVRTITKDSLGNLTFRVPPIPPGRYDIAARTGGVVSNTTSFVVTDPKNPPVHLESISPTPITYGGILTITGSGFSLQNNSIVTTYQTLTNIPSPDGKTLLIQLAPESLRGYAKNSNGEVPLPMSLYVVSDYGFSDAIKTFTMNL